MSLINKVLKPASNAYHAVAQLAGHEAPAPMQRNSKAFKLAQQAAKAGYQASPLAPYMQFTTNPSVGNLLMAALSTPGAGATPAVAITTKATQLRRVLGMGNTPREVALARKLAEAADIPMLQLNHDVRDTLLKAVPEAQHGHIQPGGIYKVPAKSKFGQFVDNRTAIIQDPESGTMFMAPGVIHGDLIEHVAKAFPQFNKGRAAGGGVDFSKWLQHEVYGKEQIMPGVITPPRWMVGATKGIDTENATIARAHLLQNLQKIGALGDINHALAAAQAQRAKMLARAKKR